MPHALILPLHCARAESAYREAVETSILAGGCTASRASLAGACLGALSTDEAVPPEWSISLVDAERVLQLCSQLAELREEAQALSFQAAACL